MTTDIKELVKRLRDGDVCKAWRHDAADALEAMAGEVERLKETITTAVQFNEGLAAERDRLKDQNIAWADKYGDTQNAMYAALDERDRLKAAITTHVAGCVACGGSGVVFLCPERDDTAEAVREDCEECVGLRKALGGDA